METTFKETLQLYLHKKKIYVIMARLTFTHQFNPVNLMNTKITHLLKSTFMLLVGI